MTAWSRERLQALLDASPYIRGLQLTVADMDVEAGSISLRMPASPSLMRSEDDDMFHGGPVAGLIDTAGDLAVALRVGGGVPTVNFRTDYLRPATGAFLMAHAQVQKVGRLLSVADVTVRDERRRVCALGRGTYVSQTG
ncbi:MAG: PaaI family thioesterase [Pseudomonadota bacterium]